MRTKRRDGNAREIIGFSLTPELARKVKAEAARRKTRLRNLFVEELWNRYQKSGNKPVADRVHRAERGTRGTRQIVGFSLPPDLAAKVKEEAERRRVSLRALFEDIWSRYE